MIIRIVTKEEVTRIELSDSHGSLNIHQILTLLDDKSSEFVGIENHIFQKKAITHVEVL